MILTLKNVVFTLVVPGTVGVYLPLMLSRNRTAATGSVFTVALLLFTIGASIYARCVFDFASFGRGTPLPLDAPKKLVRRGLYRYSRNPMYVSVLTVIFGWAVLYRSAGLSWRSEGDLNCRAPSFQRFLRLQEYFVSPENSCWLYQRRSYFGRITSSRLNDRLP